MTTLDDLILYELPGCPFCAKVDRFLKENDLEVVEEIIPISARLIANKVNYNFKNEQIRALADRLATLQEEA